MELITILLINSAILAVFLMILLLALAFKGSGSGQKRSKKPKRDDISKIKREISEEEI